MLAGIGILAMAATACGFLIYWLNALEWGMPPWSWIGWLLSLVYLLMLGLVVTMASFCIPQPK